MTSTAPTCMSDSELLAETRRVVDVDRGTTAKLVALLAEVEARMLFRGEGHSSLFTYCTHVLHLSEQAAYSRITAARKARQFPTILTRLADGDITLTTITRLAKHLTSQNHEALLDAARHKSKHEVQRLVAALAPKPDVRTSIRRQANRVPVPAQVVTETAPLLETAPTESNLAPAAPAAPAAPPVSAQAPALRRAPTPAVVAPLSPSRYLVKFTASQETHDKLQRARDLLRHAVPNGDPAAIIDRALTALIAQLEKTKHAATAQPRSGSHAGNGRACPATTRHVPAAVKRTVWARDEGRCSFVGREGRCPETGFWNSITWCRSPPAAQRASRTCSSGAARTTRMRQRCFSGAQLCPDRVRLSRRRDGRAPIQVNTTKAMEPVMSTRVLTYKRN